MLSMAEYGRVWQSMAEYDRVWQSMTKHVPFVQVPAIYEKLVKESSGRWSRKTLRFLEKLRSTSATHFTL